MTVSFNQLHALHIDLITKSHADYPDNLLIEEAQRLIELIREAGHTIVDFSQRKRLASYASYWGQIIFDATGEYPDTRLEDWSGEEEPEHSQDGQDSSTSRSKLETSGVRVQAPIQSGKISHFEKIIRFLLLSILLILIGYVLYSGNFFDAIWIIATFLLSASITFLSLAPKLLPVNDSAVELRHARQVFFTYLAGRRPTLALVREGKIVSSRPLSKKKNDREKPALKSHGVIVTDSTSVVALRTSVGLSRVEGAFIDEDWRPHSGVIFTSPEEAIDAIIDLRPQGRGKLITAQTRDGITVDVNVNAGFTPRFTRARKLNELYQLKHPSHSPAVSGHPRPAIHFPPPFAWRRASMIQVLNTRRIELDGGQTKKTDWYDRILEIAIPRLRDLISKYTVDELTAWTTTDKFSKHPRSVISEELTKLVKQEIDADDEQHRPTGIEVRGVGISAPRPPDEVIQRRIQAWIEEWRKKEADIFAQAEAEAILTRELARAQVQGEMTARINDILQEAKEADTDSSDLVMLRFLEAMEKTSRDPKTRPLLTFEALEMLKQMREILTPKQLGA